MIKSWEDLNFWESGEWQVVEEKLNDLDRVKEIYNPDRENIFTALYASPFEKTKVAILGQDPYPDHKLAMGLAFSVPNTVKDFPPSLKMIFDEYEADLHLPRPTKGSLIPWAEQGVLLWNVVPSCSEGQSLSHDWEEWRYLTREIIENLRDKGTVFAFIGGRARDYAHLVHNQENCAVIETAHPSPRAHWNKNIKHPFVGSRIFSRINDSLVHLGHDPVEWRLQ